MTETVQHNILAGISFTRRLDFSLFSTQDFRTESLHMVEVRDMFQIHDMVSLLQAEMGWGGGNASILYCVAFL